MKLSKLPTLAFFLILLTLLTTTAAGQQKRQTPDKTPAKPPAAPAPAPTFETLFAAGSFTVYGEVRGEGQLIRSNVFNEVLEPVITLAGPPKELKASIKWLNAHADELMTSRMMVAAWPAIPEVPYAVVAIEFASPEEAAKFEPQLKEILPTVLPAPAKSSPGLSSGTEKPKQAEPPRPNFYIQRAGSLVVITPTPLQLKKLKPAGSKPLFQDPNFRVARNRFSSESIFVFFDVSQIEKVRTEELEKVRTEAVAEARRREEVEEEARKKQEAENPDAAKAKEEAEEQRAELEAQRSRGTLVMGEVKEPPAPDAMSSIASVFGSALFNGSSDWPDAMGIALSLENDSIDLKALMVNSPGEKSDVFPVPLLIPGAAIVPESPNILPADTELAATMSLDFPQIHAQLSKPVRTFFGRLADDGNLSMQAPVEGDSPLAMIEKQLKINVKDELLPLLGSEIVLSLPVNNVDFL